MPSANASLCVSSQRRTVFMCEGLLQAERCSFIYACVQQGAERTVPTMYSSSLLFKKRPEDLMMPRRNDLFSLCLSPAHKVAIILMCL